MPPDGDSRGNDRFRVAELGRGEHPNPISGREPEYILLRPKLPRSDEARTEAAFEIAGPAERLFFAPSRAKAAIVTCGGLCPGLNAVIRALVLQLWHRYGCRRIIGVRYGYQGFAEDRSPDWLMHLDPDAVEGIHHLGGTMLGTSRGTPPTGRIVDQLEREGISMLFTIGGDGTMRGAQAIADEVARRGLALAVVGVPKTVDNDIPYVRRSFGFETAVASAAQVIRAAHNEARGARFGVGIVKLMGREAGYITATAVLAAGDANFCLIPEVPFSFDGRRGLVAKVAERLRSREHAVIAVAEGAGQEHFTDQDFGTDASGNPKLGNIGLLLKQRLADELPKYSIAPTIKYIDPSYIIRSSPPTASDQLFCAKLAQNAVHAAMAGKTALLVGYWHGAVTLVPLTCLQDYKQRIHPDGELWFNVLETTGQ